MNDDGGIKPMDIDSSDEEIFNKLEDEEILIEDSLKTMNGRKIVHAKRNMHNEVDRNETEQIETEQIDKIFGLSIPFTTKDSPKNTQMSLLDLWFGGSH